MASTISGGISDPAVIRRVLTTPATWAVLDEAAAQRALDPGLDLIMETCPMIEYPGL